METLSIKTTKQYLSIQNGFEWKDIPRFAVITGVNGIGKTQLIHLFNSADSGYSILTTTGGTSAKVIFSDAIKKELSVEGLIQYNKDSLQRNAKINNFNNSIAGIENHIQNLKSRMESAIDKVEKETIAQQIRDSESSIGYYKTEIKRLVVPAYENELSLIRLCLGNTATDLTEEDIRKNANPFFNSLTEIEDFSTFIKQEEAIRNEKYIALIKTGREGEIPSIRSEERSFEIINRLFQKYGFTYFEMLDPFPVDKSRTGDVVFLGRKGELVSYDALSSGEQMIVKFIIWAMGRDIRGRRINIMTIDEPDAHLHPSMCKMMVEIFDEISRSKEEGGSDIRVIITTHSPSTVAFAPEGSLFVMEKNEKSDRQIRPTNSEEAMRILSEGIFTYDKALSTFHQAAISSKNNLLFVEGKTDVVHLSRAMSVLGLDLDVDIIGVHDAVALANFIKSTPSKLFGGKKLIALFDNDGEGRRVFAGIKGEETSVPGVKVISAEQCERLSYAMLIRGPELLNQYCPIEFLYPKDYLIDNHVLRKRLFGEFQPLYKPKNEDDASKIIEDFKEEKSLRPFIVLDDCKESFASVIEQETDKQLFDGFIPTFEVIKSIISI